MIETLKKDVIGYKYLRAQKARVGAHGATCLARLRIPAGARVRWEQQHTENGKTQIDKQDKARCSSALVEKIVNVETGKEVKQAFACHNGMQYTVGKVARPSNGFTAADVQYGGGLHFFTRVGSVLDYLDKKLGALRRAADQKCTALRRAADQKCAALRKASRAGAAERKKAAVAAIKG